jgi:LPXTG-motif cell wall-anchored protein
MRRRVAPPNQWRITNLPSSDKEVTMQLKRWFKLLAAIAVLVGGAFSGLLAFAQPTPRVVDITFVNGVQAARALTDVFVARDGIPADQVVRLDTTGAKDSANQAKMLYASTAPVAPDPKNLGPFPKGAALGVTLQQWLAATGSGSYSVDGDTAELKLSFQNLVPNGTYTMWCALVPSAPNTRPQLLPCGAPDGSQNVFKADAQGNGAFDLNMKALPDTTPEQATVIAPAYHSDGKTHGASPGDFGLNSHVQLIFKLQPAASPSTLPKTGGADDWRWAVLLVLASAALGIGGWVVRNKLRRA